LFKANKRTVYPALQRGLQKPGPLGRHNALEEESEQALVAMLLEAFRANEEEAATAHSAKGDRETATWGWVNAVIGRHLDALQTCRSIPQEDTRLERLTR
jgi:hypothetical protein